jgi:hypothetical protein
VSSLRLLLPSRSCDAAGLCPIDQLAQAEPDAVAETVTRQAEPVVCRVLADRRQANSEDFRSFGRLDPTVLELGQSAAGHGFVSIIAEYPILLIGANRSLRPQESNNYFSD